MCRNCLLRQVIGGKIEGRIEAKGRRGRRRQLVLDGLEEKRGYWKLKEEALDLTVWRIGSERGCQKCLESFELWCWRRMEKISWIERVRNEEVLQRVKEERNIVHTVNRRKADWIGYTLCRNCLLKHVIGGKIEGRLEVKGRRGRRGKQLRDGPKATRGC